MFCSSQLEVGRHLDELLMVVWQELIETLAWAHEHTRLANLIRWRDKAVALSNGTNRDRIIVIP